MELGNCKRRSYRWVFSFVFLKCPYNLDGLGSRFDFNLTSFLTGKVWWDEKFKASTDVAVMLNFILTFTFKNLSKVMEVGFLRLQLQQKSLMIMSVQ